MTIDDLIAQRPRIRALALALLRNQHDADDAVQETMARAVVHRPRHSGWLVTVVRNVAASMQRTKGRARARDRTAARPEASPSTAHLVERAEWHRRVVAGLLDLPEADRDVLLMRYFDDLTPKEIARRLDQPAGTVRSRIKRSLDRLRARFDAAHGGRVAWVASLSATLARRSAVPAVLAALALLALAVFAWTRGTRAPVSRNGPSAERISAPSSGPEPDAEPVAVAPASPARISVAGFVRDWRDAPVSGAAVAAVVDGSVIAETVSGPGGGFALTHGLDVRPAFVARAPGFAPGFPVHGLILRLQPPMPFSGVLVGDRNEPVAGARVRLSRGAGGLLLAEARSDAQGRVRFDSIGPGTWHLDVVAPGYASCCADVVASARPFQIRMLRGQPVRGRVRDSTGRVLAGVEVSLLRLGRIPAQAVRTGPDGRFEFASVDPARSARLFVEGRPAGSVRAYASPKEFEIVVDGSAQRTTPAPSARRTVFGRVIDEEGAGIAGVAVNRTFTGADGTYAAWPAGGKLRLVREGFDSSHVGARDGATFTLLTRSRSIVRGTIRDAAGRPVAARIRLVLPGGRTVTVHAGPDGAWQARPAARPKEMWVFARGYIVKGPLPPGDAVIEKAHRLVVELRDERGSPVPGQEVELVGHPRVERDGTGLSEERRYISDGGGRIVWRNASAGRRVLRIRRFGISRTIAVPAAAPIGIELPATGVVTGVVQDERGRPVRALVFLSGLDTEYETDGAGRFRIPGVGPGEHTIRALTPSWGPLVAPRRGVRAGDDVVLRSRAAGIVAGRVIDPDGRSLGGLSVRLHDRVIRVQTADAAGRFFYRGLTPGTYKLEVSSGGWFADPVKVEPGAGPYTIVARRGLSISGRVNASGYVRVSAAPGLSSPIRADGSFEIRGLAPGNYHLTLWKKGQTSAGSVKANVPAGARNVVLEPRR